MTINHWISGIIFRPSNTQLQMDMTINHSIWGYPIFHIFFTPSNTDPNWQWTGARSACLHFGLMLEVHPISDLPRTRRNFSARHGLTFWDLQILDWFWGNFYRKPLYLMRKTMVLGYDLPFNPVIYVILRLHIGIQSWGLHFWSFASHT